jgi:hypothetical protein
MRLAWHLMALGAAALAALAQSTMAAPDMAAAMKTLDQASESGRAGERGVRASERERASGRARGQDKRG